MNEFELLQGLQASYDAIETKDQYKIYFTTDTGNIYVGDKLYTGKVSFTKPATGSVGILYIDEATGVACVWNAATSQYVNLVPEILAAVAATGSADASTTKLISEKALIDYVATASSGDHADVEDLKTRMATAESDINALEGQVGTLETTIDGKADKGTTLAEYGITDAYTKGETDSAISSAVAASQHLTKVVLEAEEELPEATAAQDNAIYLKPVDVGSGNQYYEEFIVINDQWEKIGDTAVDLSNYATQSWVTSQIQPVSTKADANEAAIGVINGAGEGSITKAKNDAVAEAKSYADGLASNYATAAQGALADTALQKADITTGATNGTIAVEGTDVAVAGLKSAAYAETTAFDAAGAAAAVEAKIGDLGESSTVVEYVSSKLVWGVF